ncbi:nocturnin-like isoform X1 [Paramormyrops kingsleyae]|uniref:Nocturnin n=2 Tax=Paramormyrops kingsleyae TaxID=1676925 RepID=A0A3B3QIX3_9TELE|nr:nocturnin-like isoform X1 [Paramormyrops kingsleyae]
MYPGSARLCSALLQLPAFTASSLGSPVRRSALLRRLSPAPASCHTVCGDGMSVKPTAATAAATASSRTVGSMGSSTSRLYSALAQPEQPAPSDGGDADDVLRECEQALRGRPPRLHRRFITVQPEAPQHHSIRVMQWNILAQALGEGKDSFVRCPPDALIWAERKYLILEEILTYRPDIVCLQEVDHYFDTFQPVLGRLGYHCTFQPKPRSPCLDVEHNNGPDGCSLFVRRDRFELAGSVGLQLAASALDTNQVAIMQTLRCRATGRRLCVAVTHLKACCGWERLRSAQGAHLLQALEETAQGTSVPLLVCGDFNAEPCEDVYRRFATSGLNLDSACKLLSADGQTEPPYTTWKIRPSGEVCHTLDYIWYSRHALRVDSVLDLPTEAQIGPNRLPSYSYPSDHLSLVCDVSFREEPDRLL